MTIYVTNQNGPPVDYEEACDLMVDSIAERVHLESGCTGAQEFFDAYCVEHFKVTGWRFLLIPSHETVN